MPSRTEATNGHSEVEITHRAVFPGGVKEENVVRREENEMDGDVRPETQIPAVVGVTKKLTINLGNFESASVSVHLSMPCDPDKDKVNSLFEKVNGWVDARLDTERLAIRKALK